MGDNLEAIKTYVPKLILDDLIENPLPLKEATEEEFHAAVMFADISGFTRLTEKITKNNPRGVEELGGILNIYMDKVVDLITSHGGDIVKFAGDAVFAIWPSDKKSTVVADGEEVKETNLFLETHRAVRCGLIIQQKLHNFKVASGVSLSLTIGLGTGLLHAINVGGTFDRWELVIAGDPMSQVGIAGSMANPGEVVISPQVANILKKNRGGRKANNGKFTLFNRSETAVSCHLYRPPIPAQAEDRLSTFVPRAIITRLNEGKDAWQADMRPVTVLFLKVNGFSYTDQTPLKDVQVLMKAMQKALYHYYGSINRFGVDDKGAVLLAAFGLPPFGADDDALRSVQAAFMLRQELKKIGQDCVIGIATGTVFCGTVGNETRAEYTMHGQNVNFAARLMQNATSILCDEVTYLAAKDSLEFKVCDPIKVKGSDKKVTVYEPIFDTTV